MAAHRWGSLQLREKVTMQMLNHSAERYAAQPHCHSTSRCDRSRQAKPPLPVVVTSSHPRGQAMPVARGRHAVGDDAHSLRSAGKPSAMVV
mmetsp:Transcript_7943/g.17434  ORF Transcript_7943/g.17434 Transcript_7943/m.17434 type:complete len:91 (+) Transcript_7943:411-683(+)